MEGFFSSVAQKTGLQIENDLAAAPSETNLTSVQSSSGSPMPKRTQDSGESLDIAEEQFVESGSREVPSEQGQPEGAATEAVSRTQTEAAPQTLLPKHATKRIPTTPKQPEIPAGEKQQRRTEKKTELPLENTAAPEAVSKIISGQKPEKSQTELARKTKKTATQAESQKDVIQRSECVVKQEVTSIRAVAAAGDESFVTKHEEVSASSVRPLGTAVGPETAELLPPPIRSAKKATSYEVYKWISEGSLPTENEQSRAESNTAVPQRAQVKISADRTGTKQSLEATVQDFNLSIGNIHLTVEEPAPAQPPRVAPQARKTSPKPAFLRWQRHYIKVR